MNIRCARGADGEIKRVMTELWGSATMALDGKLYDLTKHECLICEENGELLGFLHYEIRRGECEILSLDCPVPRRGAGSALIAEVRDIARSAGAHRLLVVTTNDNTTAIRFYQKRGFDIAELWRDAVTRSRAIKPQIPMTGEDGIPIRHEIALDMEILHV